MDQKERNKLAWRISRWGSMDKFDRLSFWMWLSTVAEDEDLAAMDRGVLFAKWQEQFKAGDTP